MNDLLPWLDHFQCPDCRRRVTDASDEGPRAVCAGCGRVFTPTDGIWDFLPARVAHYQGKEREKAGWARKTEEAARAGQDLSADHYLSLPDHPHPYYQAAARYLRIVMACGKPWHGKKTLELGAAECWGIRRLAEAGACGIALDYDPYRMSLGSLLLSRLPIRFLRIRGDGESLPFRDATFERIFCCSVLHHFFDLPKAVREIGRILRPGGLFFAIHEAYHPPHYHRRKIIRMSEDTLPNLAAGINERSYTAGHYRRLFQEAGFSVTFIHPKWDVREENGHLRIEPGVNVTDGPRFRKDLRSQSARNDMAGLAAKILLHTGTWRLLSRRSLFARLRFPVLNWSRKDKILVCRKHAA